jgi:hypothetical protein
MICSIHAYCIDDVQQILTLVCFSARPLTVMEIMHAYAVETEGNPRLDLENRLTDPKYLIEICQGLVGVVAGEAGRLTVRLTHSSVRSYLTSQVTKQQKAPTIALMPGPSHTMFTKICLAYLLDPSVSNAQLTARELVDLPFASYAAEFWHFHYSKLHLHETEIEELLQRLFFSQKFSFGVWVKLNDVDDLLEGATDFQRDTDAKSPI